MYNYLFVGVFYFITALCFVIKLLLPQSEFWDDIPTIYEVFAVLQYIMLSISVIISVVLPFLNMARNTELLTFIASIETKKKIILLYEDKLKEQKEYLEDQILKVFPEFERKILEKLSPGNNKELVALYNKYPKLKSSKQLTRLFDEIMGSLRSIYNEKCNLENKRNKIREYQIDPWIMFKVKISEGVL